MLHLRSTYLLVRDMEKSIEFYSQLLESKPSVITLDRWAQYDVDGICIALCNQLFDFQQIAGGVDINEHYSKEYIRRLSKHKTAFGNNVVLNFDVENLNNEYARISSLNIGDISDILYMNISLPYYFFQVNDPDGNLIEITGEYTVPARKPAFWELIATNPKEPQIFTSILKSAIEKEKLTAPETQSVVKPVAAPVAAPIIEPASEPIAEPVIEPVSAPVVEPIIEPASEPASEPIAEPIAEPVAEPVSEPAAPITPVVPVVPEMPVVPAVVAEQAKEPADDEPEVIVPIWEENSIRYTKKILEKSSHPPVPEKMPEIKTEKRPAEKRIYKSFFPKVTDVPAVAVVPEAPASPVVPKEPVKPVVPASPASPAVPKAPVKPVVPAAPVTPDVPAKEPKGKSSVNPPVAKANDAEPTPPPKTVSPPIWAQPKADHWGDFR